ncbi:MAG: hypothetical protein Kow0077_19010 [Anaerolineae bacterium]
MWGGVLLASLLGVLSGSVVNALADYLPMARLAALEEAVADSTRPLPPHYPDGTVRPARAWVALLALVTGAMVSPTGARLPRRHVLVEIMLAVASGWVVWRFGWNLQTVFYLLFLAIMALITVIDLEHRLVLFVVVLPAAALAVVESILTPEPPPVLRDALLGGVVGFALYFVMFLGGVVFSRLSRTDEIAFGFGDVMLGILSGLLLGWRPIFLALILTVVLGALGAVAFLVSKVVSRTGYSLFTALPYGPYIVAATLIIMFWRDAIRVWLLGG